MFLFCFFLEHFSRVYFLLSLQRNSSQWLRLIRLLGIRLAQVWTHLRSSISFLGAGGAKKRKSVRSQRQTLFARIWFFSKLDTHFSVAIIFSSWRTEQFMHSEKLFCDYRHHGSVRSWVQPGWPPSRPRNRRRGKVKLWKTFWKRRGGGRMHNKYTIYFLNF